MCNNHLVSNSQLSLSPLEKEFLPKTIDVHCHLQEDFEIGLGDSIVGKFAIMGTHLDDWDKVSLLYEKFSERVIPCYGIHPWFSEKALDSTEPSQIQINFSILNETKEKNITWIDSLRKKLEEHSTSLVGEIGLDKLAVGPITKKKYDMSVQKNIFTQQLQLAYIYQRPVSVHCVRAWGLMAEILETIRHDLLLPSDDASKKGYGFPPKIMFHSFMGSLDTIKRINNIFTFTNKQAQKVHLPPTLSQKANSFQPPCIYFSFSELVNTRNPDKLQELLKSLPRNRILLETDIGSAKLVDKRMATIAKAVALALDNDLSSVYQLASVNGIEFFSSK